MADVSGWKYYNHGLLPQCLPNEQADTTPIESGEIWKGRFRNAIFARWTEEFDCGCETDWWYVIKDGPFDIMERRAKVRYTIKRGMQMFRVERIDPACFVEQIYSVQVEAYSQYPEKYRPTVDREKLEQTIRSEWTRPDVMVFAAFFRQTEEFAGYALLSRRGKFLMFAAQKVRPQFEKHQVNAALVEGMLAQVREALEDGCYICDGERNIQHETAFQSYLEKYFGFRKAYCKLRIAYNPRFRWIVKVLYGFREPLKKLDHIGIVHKINGVMRMEEFVRAQGEGGRPEWEKK